MDRYIFYTDDEGSHCFRISDKIKLQYRILEKFNINTIKLPKPEISPNSDSISQACELTKSLSRSYYRNIDPIDIVNAYQKTEVFTSEQLENLIISLLEKEGFTFRDSVEFGTTVYDLAEKRIGFISYDLDKYCLKTGDFKLSKKTNYICVSGDHSIQDVRDSLMKIIPKQACMIM